MRKTGKNYHVKNLNQNFIQKDQKFRFRCTQCGDCCRNKAVEDRVLLSTVDLYRAAVVLDMKMSDVIAKYCDMIPGRESMLPLLLMKQRIDGSCIFLKKGKCIIHDGKPLVCSMYPLGRLAFLNEDTGEHEFHYYLKDFRAEGCQAEEDQIWTPESWLAEYDVEEYNECIKIYKRLGSACSKLMHACEGDSEKREMFGTAFYMMFVKYEHEKPLLEQMELNLAFVQSLKPSLFFSDRYEN